MVEGEKQNIINFMYSITMRNIFFAFIVPTSKSQNLFLTFSNEDNGAAEAVVTYYNQRSREDLKMSAILLFFPYSFCWLIISQIFLCSRPSRFFVRWMVSDIRSECRGRGWGAVEAKNLTRQKFGIEPQCPHVRPLSKLLGILYTLTVIRAAGGLHSLVL